MASFFRYPGGKSKFRDEILTAIAATSNDAMEYREPFFGGGSVGLMVLEDNDHTKQVSQDPFDLLFSFDTPTKGKNAKEKTFGYRSFWINDKDVGIFSLWNAVINNPEELKELVNSFKPSIQAFDDYKQFFLDNPTPTTISEIVECGFRKLAIHQISYSGLGVKSGGPLGGRNQDANTKYPIDCRWSPSNICKKIDLIHKQFISVDARVTNSDFAAMITDTSRPAFIYLDPPYYMKGGDLYQHAFTEDDHRRMADLLRVCPHPWVLSYDDCPEIRDLYSWARIEAFDAKYTIQQTKVETDNGKKIAATEKTELLIFPV
jgi:DNA adenine methylase